MHRRCQRQSTWKNKSRSHWLHPHHGANYPAARSSLKIRRKLAEINEGITAAAKTSKARLSRTRGMELFPCPFLWNGAKIHPKGARLPPAANRIPVGRVCHETRPPLFGSQTDPVL